MEATSNSFVQHAQEVVKKNSANIKPWEFSETEASMARSDPKFESYRKAWDSQWARVKEIMCSPQHYDCQVLEHVYDV